MFVDLSIINLYFYSLCLYIIILYNFEIPTLSGEAAIIKIPQSVSAKDLDFIQLYIENMLPVFLKNLRNEE